MKALSLDQFDAMRRRLAPDDIRLAAGSGFVVDVGPRHAPLGRVDFDAQLADADTALDQLRQRLPPWIVTAYLKRLNDAQRVEALGIIAKAQSDAGAAVEALQAAGLVCDARPARWWRVWISHAVAIGWLDGSGAALRAGPRRWSNEVAPPRLSKRQAAEAARFAHTLHDDAAAANAKHARAGTQFQKDLAAAQREPAPRAPTLEALHAATVEHCPSPE